MSRDLELIDEVLKGHEEAMKEIYATYAHDVWCFLRHYVKDVRACEEVRDDVFVEVWRSASKYRAQGSLKSWILGIARHRALDVLARRKEEVPLDPSLPHGDNPEKNVLQKESMEDLHLALGRLEEDHRAVLLMAFIGGLSYADIGQAMGCVEGTVKTRVFYARKRLKELLSEKRHG
jgi:RNA polymerase sigma-70 factor (ECF subfamily)